MNYNKYTNYPAHFSSFLKAPAEKLRPRSQIGFKSLLDIEDSELNFILLQNKFYSGLKKKLVFRVFLLYLFQAAKTFILKEIFFILSSHYITEFLN